MIEVLDTNVLVRFLVGDVPAQQKLAEKWLAEAEAGHRHIFVPSLVIAETAFVLESFYKKSLAEIAEALGVVIGQRWLRVEQRELLERTLKFYAKGQHFVDSYLLATRQILGYGILTFDKRLHKQN